MSIAVARMTSAVAGMTTAVVRMTVAVAGMINAVARMTVAVDGTTIAVIRMRAVVVWLCLTWYTIDGGGASASTGGSFSLSGSIGQPDAGSMGGGSYQLNGGFWGGASINYTIYLPLTLKNS